MEIEYTTWHSINRYKQKVKEAVIERTYTWEVGRADLLCTSVQ